MVEALKVRCPGQTKAGRADVVCYCNDVVWIKKNRQRCLQKCVSCCVAIPIPLSDRDSKLVHGFSCTSYDAI